MANHLNEHKELILVIFLLLHLFFLRDEIYVFIFSVFLCILTESDLQNQLFLFFLLSSHSSCQYV